MILATLFVAVPLALYGLAFSYETYVAFRRLGNHGPYVNVTWEITHTLLVLALTNFTWLWSDAMVAVGQAAYWGLIIATAAFVLRAILYLYLFYVSPKVAHAVADWLFAVCHLVMLSGLAYAVVAAKRVLMTQNYAVNEQLIPYMLPALVAVVVICAVPVWQSYRRR